MLNELFASVFIGKDKNWKKEELPALSEDQVWEYLKNLKVHKSIGPDEIHP